MLEAHLHIIELSVGFQFQGQSFHLAGFNSMMQNWCRKTLGSKHAMICSSYMNIDAEHSYTEIARLADLRPGFMYTFLTPFPLGLIFFS